MRRGVAGAAIAALLIVGLALAASSEDPFIVRAGTNATSQTVFAVGKGVEVTVGGSVTQTGGTPPVTCRRDAFYHFGCDNSSGRPTPVDFGLAAEDASNKGGSARLDSYTRSRVTPPYRADHVYTIKLDNARGRMKFKAYPFGGISPGAQDTYGGSFKITIAGSGSPAAKAVATVGKLIGEVAVRRRGGPWQQLTPGYVLQDDDEVFAGVESSAQIKFADGSLYEIDELTQLLVDTIVRTEDRKVVKLQLILGKIKSLVKKEKVLDTNFEIQMPTATTSRRGTLYSVFYDRLARAALISVTEGSVEVNPRRAGLPTVNVTRGKEVEVTGTTMSAPTAIGKAGARGGVNRATALGLVLKMLRRANGPCGFTSPRGGAFAVKLSGVGWSVSVPVTGKVKGKATWTVVGKKATPANALAKTIAANCR